jgi:hypothetical protein
MLGKQGIGQTTWSRGSSTFALTMPHIAYDKHDSFIALVRTLSRSVDLIAGNNPQSTLNLMLVVQADPRIRIIGAAPPQWLAANDDAGHSLLPPPAANLSAPTFSPGTLSSWSYSQQFKLPESVGKKFSFKAESRFQVLVAKRDVFVDNIDTHIGEKLSIGGLNVTLQRLNSTPTTTTVQVAIQQEPFTGDESRPVELAIQDSAGKFYSYTSFVEGRTGITTTSGTATGAHNGPYKLVVTVANRIKTVTVPIDIKDVPIP